ncbi:MAG TPA: hypothetical protein VKA34_19810 [Balneolales bacterium]|nr:hypothetical protein [Balneolales bacterium]
MRGERGCEQRGDEGIPNLFWGNHLPLNRAYGKTAEGDHHVFHSAKSASFHPRDDTHYAYNSKNEKWVLARRERMRATR